MDGRIYASYGSYISYRKGPPVVNPQHSGIITLITVITDNVITRNSGFLAELTYPLTGTHCLNWDSSSLEYEK